jgi:SAM-dependent methyltransferase
LSNKYLMGLHANSLHWLVKAIRQHKLKGRVATLGVQDVDFSSLSTLPELRGAGDLSDVFAALGFEHLESIDLSDYEGATHLFDLNCEELPSDLCARFDLVINGGTLEHVFHIPNALTNISRMLRTGGSVVHIAPCHNWVDHGFFQFSPTLMFDYYDAAGFNILESAIALFNDSETWLFKPAIPPSDGRAQTGTFDRRPALLFFLAQRGHRIVERPIPIQRLYQRTGAIGIGPTSFLPYRVAAGKELETPAVSIEIVSVEHDDGHCWIAHLSGCAEPYDSAADPASSGLILTEDGIPLGPPHSTHDAIRRLGRGAYSHWNGVLYFSSSDNSSPLHNGRQYKAITRTDGW